MKSGGRFKPGQSGNPSGRPAVVKEVRDLARQYTDKAINTLCEIMGNVEAPAQARVAAASAVLDRGYGKPGQSIEVTPGRTFDGYDDAQLVDALEAVRSLIASSAAGKLN